MAASSGGDGKQRMNRPAYISSPHRAATLGGQQAAVVGGNGGADSPGAASLHLVDDAVYELFRKRDTGKFDVTDFLESLRAAGLRPSTDPRCKGLLAGLRDLERRAEAEGTGALYVGEENHQDPASIPLFIQHLELDKETFKKVMSHCAVLVMRALQAQFVIPDWPTFCSNVGAIYARCKALSDGATADYIPQLSRVDPNLFAVSVCTIDGQRKSWGDTKVRFCLQSISKPFTYAIALNDLGGDLVHKYVGTEPSGRLFNEICLDANCKPHNPMVNAGAIVCASLLRRESSLADRFDFMIQQYRKLAGGEYIGFSNSIFLSERETADRNFALSYYMREHHCFPPKTHLKETLDFYFQLCSIEADCDSMAVMAATLANGGVCPITEERCLSNQSCRDTLSLMYSCGMYDYSGMFAFKVGLPAKSGVAGGVILVVPNVCGFAIFSPPLGIQGNSIRGVRFCEELVDVYNFHNFDNLLHSESRKSDPRKRQVDTIEERCMHVLFAAKAGDVNALNKLALRGVDLSQPDYDGRTALHLAASEGHADVVRFLTAKGRVSREALRAVDRWGNTPLDDANSFGRTQCSRLIEDALMRLGRADDASD